MARKSPTMTVSLVYVAQYRLFLLMGCLHPAPHCLLSEKMLLNEPGGPASSIQRLSLCMQPLLLPSHLPRAMEAHIHFHTCSYSH